MLYVAAAGAGQIGYDVFRDPLARLAIGGCFGAARAMATDAQEGQQTCYGRSTGLVRRQHLVQKGPEGDDRRVQALTEADVMSFDSRFDMFFGEQFHQAKVLIFHQLLAAFLNTRDLATEPSLGILVHDRPPCRFDCFINNLFGSEACFSVSLSGVGLMEVPFKPDPYFELG
jgi:hypothetical protein